MRYFIFHKNKANAMTHIVMSAKTCGLKQTALCQSKESLVYVGSPSLFTVNLNFSLKTERFGRVGGRGGLILTVLLMYFALLLTLSPVAPLIPWIPLYPLSPFSPVGPFLPFITVTGGRSGAENGGGSPFWPRFPGSPF